MNVNSSHESNFLLKSQNIMVTIQERIASPEDKAPGKKRTRKETLSK
jgi:hypothetical protein